MRGGADPGDGAGTSDDVTEKMSEADFVTRVNEVQSEWLKKCHDAGDLNRLMFSDSLIAKKFQCADKKAAYLTTFGLGPHLKQCQFEAVNKSQHYVLLFDESLNSHMQSKQMDTHVRYWVGDTIQTRYFNSQFMGHAKMICSSVSVDL